MYGHVGMMVVAALMSGALLAFLRYNFHPAQIFLGDTGSLFVGFTVAVSSLVASMKAPTTAMMLLPIGLLGYPILDISLAVLRRLIKGKPICSSDRSHIHHKLLMCGLGHRASSAVAYGFTLLFAAIVVLSVYGRHRETGVLVGLAVLGLLVMFRKFGYWGFMRRHFSSSMRRQYQLYHLLEKATILKLQEAKSVDEVWDILQHLAADYDLHTVCLDVEGIDLKWQSPGAEKKPEMAVRDFSLLGGEGSLYVSHNGQKSEDIKLEQNLLLENLSEEISRQLVRLEDEATPDRSAVWGTR
jgi:UDP-GlcNAc:undecaprenyl-phosphate GlcNAc-1-phosphate transferase